MNQAQAFWNAQVPKSVSLMGNIGRPMTRYLSVAKTSGDKRIFATPASLGFSPEPRK